MARRLLSVNGSKDRTGCLFWHQRQPHDCRNGYAGRGKSSNAIAVRGIHGTGKDHLFLDATGSHAAITLERWKRLGYILLAGLVLFAFTTLLPWARLFSGSDTCISLFALLAFGTIGLYNGAQAIAPAASLLVDLPRKPFLDMFPSLTSGSPHTILKKSS